MLKTDRSASCPPVRKSVLYYGLNVVFIKVMVSKGIGCHLKSCMFCLRQSLKVHNEKYMFDFQCF